MFGYGATMPSANTEPSLFGPYRSWRKREWIMALGLLWGSCAVAGFVTACFV